VDERVRGLKKLLWGFICVILLFSTTTITATAKEMKTTEVFVNAQETAFKDALPTLIIGRSMIPIRMIWHVLGSANIENGVIKIGSGTNYISMNIGDKKMLMSRTEILRASAPLLGNGQTIDNEASIPVLMYHHFAHKIVNNRTTVQPDEFKEQLKYLKDHGYTTITTSDLHSFKEGMLKLPEKPILITMDDGYLSNYELAYPILKELEMKATIFIVTKEVGNSSLYNPHFSWEQAKEMEDSGFVDIESHTHSSHYKAGNLAPLSSPIHGETQMQYENRIKKDLIESRELIKKHLGKTSYALAYPYGSYSPTTLKMANEAGFKVAFTIKEGLVFKTSPQFELNRFNIEHGVTGKELVQLITNKAYE
jgi:peptidoglycan/xylan/chitin deacetylase (PgdA/CDA1 family)